MLSLGGFNGRESLSFSVCNQFSSNTKNRQLASRISPPVDSQGKMKSCLWQSTNCSDTHGHIHKQIRQQLLISVFDCSGMTHRRMKSKFEGAAKRRVRGRKAINCVMQPPSKEASSSEFSDIPVNERKAGHLAGAGEWHTLPDVWETSVKKFGDSVALIEPHRGEPSQFTYAQVKESIDAFADGLLHLGVSPGDVLSLFSDNSHRWLIADQGIMAAGAADAVRGGKASPSELCHIAIHSDSVGLVVESFELLKKLTALMRDSGHNQLRFAVVLWGESSEKVLAGESGFSFPVHMYEEVLVLGRESKAVSASHAALGVVSKRPSRGPDDLATIVYTSGTTGSPKGVMLTHKNLLHQVNNLGSIIDVVPGDTFLSLLPPWHMYERSAEYYVLSRGGRQVYTNVQSFKEDLVKFPPDFFVAVPLVFDILYSGVRQRLASLKPDLLRRLASVFVDVSLKFMEAKRVARGLDLSSSRESPGGIKAIGRGVLAHVVALVLLPIHLLAQILVYKKIRTALGIRKAAVSGGGSLPGHVDRFFEALGIMLLNGYGLTETSPVLTARVPSLNVLGTVGMPVPYTQVNVVDPLTGETLPHGEKGLVKAKGPQIMKGYYKNQVETAKVIDSEGFFNTGDLGWITPAQSSGPARNCGGQLVLQGRIKDTIVLANGENVEPEGLEEVLLQSKLISQVMLVGQDQRRLGALIVPNKEEVKVAVLELRPKKTDVSEPTAEEVHRVLRQEIKNCLSSSGRPVHERIGIFAVLEDTFSIENGLLTPTMKLKRGPITDYYKERIDEIYK